MAGYGSGTNQVGPAGILAKHPGTPKQLKQTSALVYGFGEHVVMIASRVEVESKVSASKVALDVVQMIC